MIILMRRHVYGNWKWKCVSIKLMYWNTQTTMTNRTFTPIKRNCWPIHRRISFAINWIRLHVQKSFVFIRKLVLIPCYRVKVNHFAKIARMAATASSHHPNFTNSEGHPNASRKLQRCIHILAFIFDTELFIMMININGNYFSCNKNKVLTIIKWIVCYSEVELNLGICQNSPELWEKFDVAPLVRVSRRLPCWIIF